MTVSADLCAPWIGYDEVHHLKKYEGLSEDDIAPWLMPASEICFRLSGRHFQGLCTVTSLRPCRNPCYSSGRRREAIGYTQEDYGGWLAYWSGPCTCGQAPLGACSCGSLFQLDLSPWFPVQEITEVKVDGEVIDTSLYQLYEARVLTNATPVVSPTLTDVEAAVSTGGWPGCQDLRLPDSEPGTWSISFKWGSRPPEDAQMACAMLAGELALAGVGATGCTLPERVQTVTRQGITFALLDPQTFLDAGRTGIYLIDLWLASMGKESGPDSGASLAYPTSPSALRHR